MKTRTGNFLEDFEVGRVFDHAPARDATDGDGALYVALTGSRFALNVSTSCARSMGLTRPPLDDMLVFHLVFGKSVPDISLNAVANLGYAEGVFGAPVYPGDTIAARSTVLAVKENSNRQTGVVHVRTEGTNQRGEAVLGYVRWVMVRKRDPDAPIASTTVPAFPDHVSPDRLVVPEGLTAERFDVATTGQSALWDDYAPGLSIDHVDGMTIEEAEHMMATRLYHNTAKVHFNQFAAKADRFGRRLIYGGHVISLARALSVNGLGNALRVAAINGGRHVAPCFAGDTVHAWTRVLDCAQLPGRRDLGALRLHTIATRDQPCADFPLEQDGKPHPAVILDLDYWALMPRRP
jgi:2-methylfumaryl-CoA hydratase